MANQLVKLADVTYTPGTPTIAPRPAYCYWAPVVKSGYWAYPGRDWWLYNPKTGKYGFMMNTYTPVWVPGTTTLQEVCLPAEPGQVGTPPSISHTAVLGWNGGARSADPMIGNGYFGFKVSDGTIGAVVGLVRDDQSTLPNEQTHAFFVHDGQVQVMESGVIVATAPTPHAGSKQLRIVRGGTTVTYAYDGWTYQSAKPASGNQYLDASLYMTSDSIYDPVLGVEVTLTAKGQVGVRDALGGTVGGIGYLRGARSTAGLTSRVRVDQSGATRDLGLLRGKPGLTSRVDMRIDHALTMRQTVGLAGRTRFVWAGALDDVPPFDGSTEGSAFCVLPALNGIASDMLGYSQAYGELPAITGSAEGAMPVIAFSYAYGMLPPPAGSGMLAVGNYAEAAGDLPAFTGMGSYYPDANYSQAGGTLLAITGGGVLMPPEADKPRAHSGMLMGDFFFARAMTVAKFYDGLSLTDEMTAVVKVSASFVDALGIGTGLTFRQTIQAIFNAGLAITGDTKAAQREAIQYAINTLTGAPTTYKGFQFDGFASTSYSTYGFRKGGLYRIGGDTDNGEAREWSIDFGQTDFGTAQSKILSAVYLGLSTDGEVYAKITTDNGEERLYKLSERGPMMHAHLARGISGRRWNVNLEATDATSAELGIAEFVIASAGRRLGGRQ